MAVVDDTVDQIVNEGNIDPNDRDLLKEKVLDKASERIVDEMDQHEDSEQVAEAGQPDAGIPMEAPPETAADLTSPLPGQEVPVEQTSGAEVPLTPEQLQTMAEAQDQTNVDSAVTPPEQQAVLSNVDKPFEELSENVEQTAQAEMDLAVKTAENEQRRQEAQAKIITDSQTEEAKALERVQDNADKLEAKRLELTEKFEKLDKELTNNPINRQQLIDSMPLGRKIMGFIGMALGGADAVKSFNHAIDAQIRLNENHRTNRVKRTENLIDMFEKQYKTAEEVKAATKLHFAKDLENKIKAIQEKFPGDTAIKLGKTLVDIQKEKNGAMEKLSKSAIERRKVFGTYEATEGEELPGDVQLHHLPKGQQERVGVAIPSLGSGRFMSSAPKAAITQFNKEAPDANATITALQTVLDYAEENKLLIQVEGSPERAQFTSDMEALVGKLRIPITGPGILSEPDKEMIRKAIGDPSKIFAISSNQRKVMAGRLKSFKRELRDKLQQMGHRPTKKGKTINSFKKEE